MPNVTQTHHGDRIGKEGKIRLGCSALIRDESGEKILLTQRADNGQWCLPGGGVDPGESVEEAIIREIDEETGLKARVTRLIGVYSDPHKLVEYPDGNKVQIVALSFEAEIIGGELALSNETTDFGYFTLAEIVKMDVLLNHTERIRDALQEQNAPFIK